MLNPASYRRFAAFAGAAALVLSAAIPASGATTPGWRVVKTFGPASGVWSGQFAASGARNAWSTWTACGPCSGQSATIHFYLEHSAGGAWSKVPVPAADATAAGATESIGTSSSRNLWLFSGTGGTGKVLRFNGSTWQQHALPSWVIRMNLSGNADVVTPVFGPGAAWVFSLGQDSISSPDHYAARWNGSTWRKVAMPGIPSEVSAVSAGDIWALGSPVKAPSKSILMHWDGKRWHTVPVATAKAPAGATEYVRDLAAAGPRSVWLQRGILQGNAGARTLYLLHWNGRTWTRIRPGKRASLVNYLAQDGHGGVWLAANGPAPAYQWRFVHFSAGRWTVRSVPAAAGTSVLDVTGLTQIPGTRSAWASANMSVPGPANDVDGAILKYGP